MDQQHSMTLPRTFYRIARTSHYRLFCGKIRTSAPSGRFTNVQCTADADRSIVATALDLLQQSYTAPVLIKCDETYILILCLTFIQATPIGLLNRPLHKTPGLYLERSGYNEIHERHCRVYSS